MPSETLRHAARSATGRLFAAAAATLGFSLCATSYGQTMTDDRSIRPFKVQIPQAALDDLRRRINATRWPDKETAADRSQGAQLADLQALLRYWGTDYKWRNV